MLACASTLNYPPSTEASSVGGKYRQFQDTQAGYIIRDNFCSQHVRSMQVATVLRQRYEGISDRELHIEVN